MIRCVILDDEPWSIDLLVSYIEKVDFLSLSVATNSPVETLSIVSQRSADLLFLDINMPEMTGLQVLEIMNNKMPVIISSAYPEYAINGYNYNVIDYLLKPIEFERFLKGALKAQEILQNESFIKNRLEAVESIPNRDFVFIKTDGKLVKISYAEILYIEGKRDYIQITTTDDKLLSLDTLGNMETVLPASSFIRIHKSYIISLNKISFIEGNRLCINNDYLPIGDTYKNALLKAIKN